MLEFLKKLNPYHHRGYVRELLALRSKRGPYRFSVRTWQGITDIDLAVRVLQAECFRSEVEPMPLPVESLESILVLAPHQDDEAIGSGGALLLASKAGANIDVAYITDGAQNKTGQPKDLDRIREKEARNVCLRLKADIHQIGISNLEPRPGVDDVERLSDLIRKLKPQVVMAPWLLDWPSKHRMVNHLLWLAKQWGDLPDFEVWGYQVHNTPFVNGYVDITSVAEEKRTLLECYASQNSYCRYDHIAMGLAAWNAHLLASAPEPRYLEVFFALPSNEFFRLVESFYLTNLESTYRGDAGVITGMIGVHRAIVGANSIVGRSGLSSTTKKVIKKSAVAAVVLAQSLTDLSF